MRSPIWTNSQISNNDPLRYTRIFSVTLVMFAFQFIFNGYDKIIKTYKIA